MDKFGSEYIFVFVFIYLNVLSKYVINYVISVENYFLNRFFYEDIIFLK